jgi:Flp pilus assembly pilin Flp
MVDEKKEDAMRARLEKFLSSENAASAIEYALIAAGIATAIAAVVYVIGASASDDFTAAKDSFQ